MGLIKCIGRVELCIEVLRVQVIKVWISDVALSFLYQTQSLGLNSGVHTFWKGYINLMLQGVSQFLTIAELDECVWGRE